jgi:hypothetical protein
VTGYKIEHKFHKFSLAVLKGVEWEDRRKQIILKLECRHINDRSTPGVNFTNILRAAFAPVDLRPTYWRTAQRVQRISWADFLVLWTRRVGRRFVGETEWHKRMTTSAFALCASGLVKLTPGDVINGRQLQQSTSCRSN